MPTFRYQAYSADGKISRGRKEGLHAKEVRERLLAEGLYAREVQPVSEGPGRKAFSLQVRSMFYRELSALLKAGLPLDRALEILSEHPELGAGDDILPLIRDLLREGQTFSVCVKEHFPGIREDEVAVLAAGEAAGRLSLVAGELADFLDQEARVSDQIRGALVYPAVVLVLVTVVLGVLVGYLLPVYEKLLAGLQQELPPLTRGILGLGAAIRHPLGIACVLLLTGILLRGLRNFLRHPEAFLPERRYTLPVLGFTLASLARARFSRTLALLLEGGVALPEGIKVSGRATGSLFLKEKCLQASEEISQGMRVAESVGHLPVLCVDLPGWIRAGEASGDLSGMLRHAALSHQRAWDRGLSRLLSLLEPVLIVFVGTLILLVALAILLPMLKVNQSLGF
ncbi:MAG: type II secretion system F family protein [Kiritimatiellia bacterium]